MRDYYPIWYQLKKDKTVSITVSRAFHPRIIKAVCKEKWMDLGYKIMNDSCIPVLSHTTKGAILIFMLTLKPKPLTPRDLGFSYIDLHESELPKLKE